MSTLVYFGPWMCTRLFLWLVVSTLAQKTDYCTTVIAKANALKSCTDFVFTVIVASWCIKFWAMWNDQTPNLDDEDCFKDGILPYKLETIKINVFPPRVLNETVENSKAKCPCILVSQIWWVKWVATGFRGRDCPITRTMGTSWMAFHTV